MPLRLFVLLLRAFGVVEAAQGRAEADVRVVVLGVQLDRRAERLARPRSRGS